jgi:hypothetical protein
MIGLYGQIIMLLTLVHLGSLPKKKLLGLMGPFRPETDLAVEMNRLELLIKMKEPNGQ